MQAKATHSDYMEIHLEICMLVLLLAIRLSIPQLANKLDSGFSCSLRRFCVPPNEMTKEKGLFS